MDSFGNIFDHSVYAPDLRIKIWQLNVLILIIVCNLIYNHRIIIAKSTLINAQNFFEIPLSLNIYKLIANLKYVFKLFIFY